MNAPISVMVLYGGKSGEHEISLLSAASVLKNLDSTRYTIIPVGIDKKGCFFQNDYNELLNYDKLPVKTEKSIPLPSLMVDGKLSIDVQVIFPVMHGPLYEDGAIQGLFKLANAAFVGCDVLASALGMDKDIARRLVKAEGILFAQYRSISWHSSPADRQEFYQQTVAQLGWPLFVKPCSLGSSVGIHKVTNFMELAAAVDDALRYDETILVEEFLSGREIEVAVLEHANPSCPPEVSIAGEIKSKHLDGFYSYAAKYIDVESTDLIAPAILDDAIEQEIKAAAAKIFTTLKCKGLARVDFFVNDSTQKIYFNEINTLPGFTAISMYPRLWQVSGLSYANLLDRLVKSALTHYACRQHIVTDYQ